MATRSLVETRQDRKALVADAGFRQLSVPSAAAGVLSAYGAFALLAGIAVGVLKAANVDIDVSSQWRQLGMSGGLVVAGLLLVAYLFGGYVSGRMARRSSVMHGVVVFVLGVAVAAAAAVFARWLGGADVASSNLRDLGVPTTASEWGDIATVAGIASLAAMLVGSLLGATMGERWHSKLVTRALDPRVGAEADAVRESEKRAAEAERRSADARDLRTGSFERVRAATPSRSRRVDSEAATQTMPVPAAAGPVRPVPASRGVATDGMGNGSVRRVRPAPDEERTSAVERERAATAPPSGR